ncbi:MAG: hypothetical protein JXD18_05090 [Anaerolineae bacterium]|nr:hypothetical protein [Anaerolineae bacterium]
MSEQTLACDFCGDPIDAEPIVRGSKVYCSEACAFEAGRSADCGGRTDTVMAQPIVESPFKEK